MTDDDIKNDRTLISVTMDGPWTVRVRSTAPGEDRTVLAELVAENTLLRDEINLYRTRLTAITIDDRGNLGAHNAALAILEAANKLRGSRG